MGFDISNLALVRKTRVDRFKGRVGNLGNLTATAWLTWTKPKNASMHMLICIGAGAAGGCGASGASGTSRTGGAGGARGAISTLLIPSVYLPKTLFLFPGHGGLGGPSGVGEDGTGSAITDRVNTFNTAADTILQSGVLTGGLGAQVGLDGTTTQASGRASEGIETNVRGVYQGLGVWSAYGDVVITGANGGAVGANPGDNTLAFGANAIPLTEGAGGGSLSTGDVAGAGGNVVGGGRIPTLVGGAAGGATGGDGPEGLSLEEPWLQTGGAGGGAGTTQGGRGGNGGIGCGGGGGGGGITGGDGGSGGPGLIIIVSW